MPRRFLVCLAVVGAALTATVVPGAFTIDEANYLASVHALRHGRLTVPGTEGLPPTRELIWFDPQAHSRRVEATPVAPTVPPLYAPLALPASFLGWRALVALNTLAFLYTAALVFLWARRYGEREAEGPVAGVPAGGEGAAWLAAAAFIVGSYGIEYAQGLWPHMVAVALTTTAAYLAFRLREGAALGWALVAGLAAGWAAGVRYQNVAFACLVGAGIFFFTRRRWRASLFYGAGLVLPLAACSLINRARLGFWNPVSKGPRYLSRGGDTFDGNLLAETFTMFWSRVVDYAQRPPIEGLIATYLAPHPESGVYLVSGAVKKAWLQSSPWLVIPLLLIVLCWLRWSSPAARSPVTRETRAISLIVLPILAVFAMFGVNRTDGLSFNQRYFLELVPLMSVVLGWTAARVWRAPRSLALGFAAGLLLAMASLVRPPEAVVRHLALSWIPLGIAVLVLAVWLLRRRWSLWGGPALAVAVAIGFALGAHVGDDIAAARRIRAANLERYQAVQPHIPQRAAIFAYWGGKDSLAPFLLDRRRDLVMADPFADRGKHAALLVDEFLAEGRQVLVLPPFPPPLVQTMRRGRALGRRGPLLEIGSAPAPVEVGP